LALEAKPFRDDGTAGNDLIGGWFINQSFQQHFISSAVAARLIQCPDNPGTASPFDHRRAIRQHANLGEG